MALERLYDTASKFIVRKIDKYVYIHAYVHNCVGIEEFEVMIIDNHRNLT